MSEEKSYNLVNAYEYTVMNTVRKLIEQDPDMCRCEKCFLDVCALIFNNGYSRFVTTERGALLATLNEAFDTGRDVELLVEAMNAIKMVKSRPNH